MVDDGAYRAARTQFQPGDLLCIVSDGVTESNNRTGELYGTARVDRLLVDVDSAAQAVDAIGKDVRKFEEGAEPADDMTVLAVRWRGAF